MRWDDVQRYPLADLVTASGLTESALARAVGLSGTTLKDARARGLVERAADRYAARVGLHPALVWPEWLDEATELASVVCPGCDRGFVPLRRSHRYCTKECYQRKYKRDRARHRYATDPEFRERQIAKARAYRTEHAHAYRVKKRAYYLANRDALRARRIERRSREAA